VVRFRDFADLAFGDGEDRALLIGLRGK